MQPVDLKQIVLVIPSFKPPRDIIEISQRLHAEGIERIIIVDDGSPAEYQTIFNSLRNVTLLKNTTNLGKGAALKNAYNYLLKGHEQFRFVLSCDDDGQHSINDIINVATHALKLNDDCVWLGSRSFKGNVPVKSQIGNLVMRYLLRFMTGEKLRDTQTGLRCIPTNALKEICNIPQNGFNYELIALLQMIKKNFKIKEQPIETIYFDKNQGTRFKSTLDSIKVIASCFAFYFKK